MRRRRTPWRFRTLFLLVLSLLFSQLALANYLCPGAADTAAMADTMAAGAPCTGMDDVQPVLCHQHAMDAAQSFELAKLATPTMPALVPMLVLPLAFDTERDAVIPMAAAFDPRPPPDPVFLATLRLRV